MVICDILDDPRLTPEQAQHITVHVRRTGSLLPDGARLVVCGPTDPGRLVISVWDSPEACQRFFAERLNLAYEAAGLSLEAARRTQFEVQLLIAGDLVGAPQRR